MAGVTSDPMSAISRKLPVAWIALCAMLFSGFSSTLAAMYFQGHVGIPAEICTSAGIKSVTSSEDQSNEGAPAKSGGSINCVQCLGSASAPVIATSPVVALFGLVAGGAPMPSLAPAVVHANPDLSPPSRGPPAAF